MEVDGGSIFVDFRKGDEQDDQMYPGVQEEDPIVPSTPNNVSDMQTFGNVAS